MNTAELGALHGDLRSNSQVKGGRRREPPHCRRGKLQISQGRQSGMIHVVTDWSWGQRRRSRSAHCRHRWPQTEAFIDVCVFVGW